MRQTGRLGVFSVDTERAIHLVDLHPLSRVEKGSTGSGTSVSASERWTFFVGDFSKLAHQWAGHPDTVRRFEG